jgi:hypothetical protein
MVRIRSRSSAPDAKQVLRAAVRENQLAVAEFLLDR